MRLTGPLVLLAALARCQAPQSATGNGGLSRAAGSGPAAELSESDADACEAGCCEAIPAGLGGCF